MKKKLSAKAQRGISVQEVIKVFEELFDHFNQNLFLNALKRPKILLQTIGRSRRINGYTEFDSWGNKEGREDEITISADILNQKTVSGIPKFAKSILHEMIHLYDRRVLGLEDVSENGYHKKRIFGKSAKEHGLSVIYSAEYPGCVTPDLDEKGKKCFRNFNYDRNLLDNFKLQKPKKEGTLRTLECISCQYKVYVYVRFSGSLICGVCRTTLTPAKKGKYQSSKSKWAG